MAQPEPQAIHASQHESVPEAGAGKNRTDYGFAIFPPNPSAPMPCFRDNNPKSERRFLSNASPVFTRFFPIIYWLPNYFDEEAGHWKEFLLNDVLAGFTVGVMIIPQAMAYALLAGMEPIAGLYTAMWGCIVYTFFGTSGQVGAGPVAIVSLLTLESLHSNGVKEGTTEYAQLAALLAFETGIFSCILGLIRAGILAQLLSHAVIVGFTGAAALIIAMSQMRHVFGFDYESGEFIIMLIDFIRHIDQTNYKTLLLSLAIILILLFFKTWKKRPHWPLSAQAKFIPAALIVVVLSTSLSYSVRGKVDWAIVGSIQPGVPSVSNFFEGITPSSAVRMLPAACIITLLSFIETYAVGGKFASMKGYEMDASQELIALGVSNFVASFFNAYPLSGSLSRTAVAYSANAVSPIYSLVVGVFLIVTLLAITPLFFYLPRSCLGSIVVVAVVNLFDYHAMKYMWKVKRTDFAVTMFTFVLTLLFGVEVGVLVGVLVSVLVFLRAVVKPNYDIMGQVPGSHYYRPLHHIDDAEVRPDVLIMSWDAPIFFGNVSKFKERVVKHIRRKFIDYYADGIRTGNKNATPRTADIPLPALPVFVREESGSFYSESSDEERAVPPPQAQGADGLVHLKYPSVVILYFGSVTDIDSAATEALHPFFEHIVETYGVTLLFAETKEHVKETMILAELLIDIGGEDHFLDSIQHAVEFWDKNREDMISHLPKEAVSRFTSMETVPEHPSEDTCEDSWDVTYRAGIDGGIHEPVPHVVNISTTASSPADDDDEVEVEVDMDEERGLLEDETNTTA